MGTVNPAGAGFKNTWANIQKGEGMLSKLEPSFFVPENNREYLVGGVIHPEAFEEKFLEENKVRMADPFYYQVNSVFREAIISAGMGQNGSLDAEKMSHEERERIGCVFGIFNNNPEGTSDI